MDSSRDRIVETTARLLWKQGLRATGINQIAEESRAPRGSIYFHFPDGKEQLAAAALKSAGAVMTANITEALAHRSTPTAIKRFVASYAKEMTDSEFHHGCPIATVALEAATTSEPIREVCAAVFADWEGLLRERLERDGFTNKQSRELAVVVLSGIEGAMILCRARKSTEPLHLVEKSLLATLAVARTSRTRKTSV